MGSLPLQLALERNASIEVVAALIQVYPEAEGVMDLSSRVTYADKLAEAKASMAPESSSGIRVSAAPQFTREASELVAKLKAQAPNSEVLPLITKEAAATKCHVRHLRPLHPSERGLNRCAVHSLKSCRCTGPRAPRRRRRW